MEGKKIRGLGIRINRAGVETGQYKDDLLEGTGRRLRFGESLYEGEFIQGQYCGRGTETV